MRTLLSERQVRLRGSGLDYDVVTRRIPASLTSLVRRLANVDETLPGGRLELDGWGALRLAGPFERRERGRPEEWRTWGRLTGHGPRLVPYARVDLAIAPWSEDACELRVVPRSHHLHKWGARRLRRYFLLAHAAADHLRLALIEEAARPLR